MRLFQLFSFIIVLSLFACNENRVYENHHKNFPNYSWKKSKTLEFNPEIQDTSATYRVYLAFRHIYGFQFKHMDVSVSRVSPSGNTQTETYNFPVFGPDGKYLSDCAEDICDLEVVVEESVKFPESGTYKYTIEHQMPMDRLPNVMEFGLVIEKHESDVNPN